VVYPARPGWSVTEAVMKLLKCDALDRAIFVTKPAIVTVWGSNRRSVQLAIPPSSIILDSEISEFCGLEERGFTVAEDAWVDGKTMPSKDSLTSRGGDCPMVKSLEEVFGELGASGRCLALCGGSLDEVIKNSLNPMVVDLSTFENVKKVEVCGTLRTLWRSHPVLYGLDMTKHLCLNVADVRNTVLKHYIKTIAYIGDGELLYEIPYSSSIIFTGYDRQLLELAVRAVIYSC